MSSKFPPHDLSPFSYSKEAQESSYYQNLLKQREKESESEERKIEKKLEIQGKEVIRQKEVRERVLERSRDRRFNVWLVILGSVLAAIITKVFDYIF